VKTVGARQVWAVQEVTAALGRRLAGIPSVWVEAEIQNLRQRGGQVYFTLRDTHQIDASMRAVLFDRLEHRPADGSLVYAYGRVEFWAERAQVSMRIERVEPAGEGALLARIEATKARLAQEGLLADARKRPLPLVPRRIGLVTSAAGAARQDILNNLWARFPADVVLADVPVQGTAAPRAIVRALAMLNAIPEIDVIIVARGGGPLEDLMAFNDEQVCRAVAASRAPVVSAIGHEKDVTVCDLVADRRVSTPTGAAEAVVTDKAALDGRLADAGRGLVRGLTRVRESSAASVHHRTLGLIAGLRGAEHRSASRVAAAAVRLEPAVRRVADASALAVPVAQDRLTRAAATGLQTAAQRVAANAALLEVLSPSRTVARGYAIVRDAASGSPVVSTAQMRAGAELELELRDGRADVTVKETHQ
jgi:exodeoxyribonuclease VII large subunit